MRTPSPQRYSIPLEGISEEDGKEGLQGHLFYFESFPVLGVVLCVLARSRRGRVHVHLVCHRIVVVHSHDGNQLPKR